MCHRFWCLPRKDIVMFLYISFVMHVFDANLSLTDIRIGNTSLNGPFFFAIGSLVLWMVPEWPPWALLSPCLVCFLFTNVHVSCFFEKLRDFEFKNELFQFAISNGEWQNVEKSCNYGHDHHPPHKCQEHCFRVHALKIWKETDQ